MKGGPAFTHISYDDHLVIYDNLIEGRDRSIEGRVLPYALYTDPELGRVGMTEREAREAGYRLKVGSIPMAWVARARERSETKGMMKVVINAETETGERPPTYVPEETANLGFMWGIGDSVRLIADARYVGERFGGIPIPSYTVVDASVRFDVSDKIGFTFKADNIFDELYATSNYYEETWLVGKPRTASLAFDFTF